LVAGERGKMEEYLREARRVAETVPDVEARKMLEDDLDSIE